MYSFQTALAKLEALKQQVSKGCEFPWNSLLTEIRTREQAIADQVAHIAARQIGEALLTAYASAPVDQSVSLKLNLTDIVNCFTDDPREGDTIEGLIMAHTKWFFPATSA